MEIGGGVMIVENIQTLYERNKKRSPSNTRRVYSENRSIILPGTGLSQGHLQNRPGPTMLGGPLINSFLQ